MIKIKKLSVINNNFCIKNAKIYLQKKDWQLCEAIDIYNIAPFIPKADIIFQLKIFLEFLFVRI